MNGIVSHSMRTKGVNYKINFGLTMPLLRRVAEQVPHTVEVARMLWQDVGVRESLMLAPMVYPVEQCTPADAQRWVVSMPNIEVADFCCKYLFSRLPYALELARQWVAAPVGMVAYTGYRLSCALLSQTIDKEWLEYVAEKAIVQAYSNRGVEASVARSFLTEALLLPHSGRVVVELLRASADIDDEWRENLIALYDEEF